MAENKPANKLSCKLTIYGGVGTATGANIMLEIGEKKILIDCGILQGLPDQEKINAAPFKYNPAEVEYLLITHAHMDHIGKIPKLVRDGFKGKIISTEETKEISMPSLQDAYRIMLDKNHGNPIYDEKDVEHAFSLWEGRKYHEPRELFPGVVLTMKNSGHILGSAIMEVSCGEGEDKKKFAFTGDLGNSPSPLLPDCEPVVDADYIVMESVYGDRNHEDKKTRREMFKKALLDGMKRGGPIIIPAFSIERTQVLLYELNNMIEDKEIPEIPVFLDSPLAQKTTAIYTKFADDFKENIREEIRNGDNIFKFPLFSMTHSRFESEHLEKLPDNKIILAGSGMSEGGRIINHELKHLSDPRATIIITGYQAIGTLGRHLEEGLKEVEVWQDGYKQKVQVKAKIEKIFGYSSHMDSDHLVEFVGTAAESKKLKKVFVIMGEPKSSLFLVQRLRDYLGVDAIYPEPVKTYDL